MKAERLDGSSGNAGAGMLRKDNKPMRGEKFVPIPVMQVGEIVLLRNGEGRREHR